MKEFGIFDHLTLSEQGVARGKATRQVVTPSVLIGVGGTGAKVLSIVKAQVRWLGLQDMFRFIIVDSDTAAIGGAPGGHPFDGEEYLHLSHELMRNVLDYPELSPDIASRLDLDDRNVLAAMREKIQSMGEDEGCGQIRPIGALRFASNYSHFKDRLEHALSEVRDVWGKLLTRLKGVNRTDLKSAKTPVLIVGSVCGGTGSAVLVDTVVATRHLEKDVSITGYLAMPSVYSAVVDAEQEVRLCANAYATLQELDFFQRGLGAAHGVKFSYVGGADVLPAPDTLFTACHLVERKDASGGDLGHPKRVYDAMALAITSEIALAVGARLRSGTINQVAVSLASGDVQTGATRWFGTLGATAISLPRRRIVEYGAFRSTRKLLEERVLGPELPSETVQQEVDQWLLANRIDNRHAQGKHLLVQVLQEHVGISMSAQVDKLFQIKGKGANRTRVCPPDKKFTRSFDSFVQRWDGQSRATLSSKLARAATAQQKPLAASLDAWVRESVDSRGLRPTQSVVSGLSSVLRSVQVRVRQAAERARGQARDAFSQARMATERMRGLLGQLGTDEAAQADTATALELALSMDYKAAALDTGSRMLAVLDKHAVAWQNRLSEAVDVREPELKRARERESEKLSVSGEVFGDGNMEISVLAPGEVTSICEKAHPGTTLLPEVMAALGGNQDLEAMRHPNLGDELLRGAAAHYFQAVGNLNVADLLAEALEKGGEEHGRVLFEEVMRACRPLWQARNPGNQQFPESIVVGVPSEPGEASWRPIESLVKSLASEMKFPGYLHNAVAVEPISDPARIYVTRRAYGGRPHYLPSWRTCGQSYKSLARLTGALSLHGFSRRTVSRLPAMEPDPNRVSDLAFALGMAYGWIAQRGRTFYANLRRRRGVDETMLLDAPVVTQWTCLVAEDGKRRAAMGEVTALVNAGVLRYKNGTKLDKTMRLGGTRGNAMERLRQADDVRDLIVDAYDALRELVAPSRIADELEHYAEQIENKTISSDRTREVIAREAALLRAQIDELRET